MKSWLSYTAASIFIVPLAGKCNGSSGGGGGTPSPSSSIHDWLSSFNVASHLPAGAADLLHSIPVVNWLV